MRVLVTGVSGYIAYHVCKQLLARGDQVIGVDSERNIKQSTRNKERIQWLLGCANANHFTLVTADLVETHYLNEVLGDSQADAVIHIQDFRDNIKNAKSLFSGLINLLELSKEIGIKHFIYTSSSQVYYPHSKVAMSANELTDHPRNLMASVAKSCELLTHSYSQQYNLPCTGLRLFEVYGPNHDSDNFLQQLLTRIIDDEPMNLTGLSAKSLDFTYIDDVTNCIIRVLEHVAKPALKWSLSQRHLDSSESPWRIFNVGTGVATNIKTVAEMAEKLLDKKAQIVFSKESNEGELVVSNNEPILKELGFKPRTKLETGLATMVNSLVSEVQ